MHLWSMQPHPHQEDQTHFTSANLSENLQEYKSSSLHSFITMNPTIPSIDPVGLPKPFELVSANTAVIRHLYKQKQYIDDLLQRYTAFEKWHQQQIQQLKIASHDLQKKKQKIHKFYRLRIHKLHHQLKERSEHISMLRREILSLKRALSHPKRLNTLFGNVPSNDDAQEDSCAHLAMPSQKDGKKIFPSRARKFFRTPLVSHTLGSSVRPLHKCSAVVESPKQVTAATLLNRWGDDLDFYQELAAQTNYCYNVQRRLQRTVHPQLTSRIHSSGTSSDHIMPDQQLKYKQIKPPLSVVSTWILNKSPLHATRISTSCLHPSARRSHDHHHDIFNSLPRTTMPSKMGKLDISTPPSAVSNDINRTPKVTVNDMEPRNSLKLTKNKVFINSGRRLHIKRPFDNELDHRILIEDMSVSPSKLKKYQHLHSEWLTGLSSESVSGSTSCSTLLSLSAVEEVLFS